ncbi:MAG: ATP-binding cassette domain-containing protein [Pseudomonadota bacterium]
MSVLTLSAIGHAYLGRTVLDRIELTVGQGEIVALVGPSGCGKSTLAHIAAGLTEPRAGRVSRTYRRHAMIFQEPSLLPWATGAGNIDYVCRLAGLRREERTERIARVAQAVALDADDLKKYPIELSGGMRQRVAIARALAVDPDFIYFDEPFTALDVALRRRMQDLVIATCAGGQLSGLFITHDLHEATRIADKIAVLDTRGNGILGVRAVPGEPTRRAERDVFAFVDHALHADPLFREIHDVDERQIA